MLFFYKVGDFIKRIFIVAIILTLSLQNVFYVKANTEISHEKMVEMYGEGYADTLLSSTLEAHAKLAVNDVENREALDGWINNSKDYLKQRAQAYKESIRQNADKDFLSAYFGGVEGLFKELATGVLNLTDFGKDLLGNLFGSDYKGTVETNECFEVKDGHIKYGSFFMWSGTKCNYHLYVDGVYRGNTYVGFVFDRLYSHQIQWSNGINASYFSFEGDVTVYNGGINNIYQLDQLLRRATGGKSYILFGENQTEQTEPKQQVINNITNYINNNPSPVKLPILKPQATCPEGQRVIVPDGKGGFLDSNGKLTNVTDCTITWLAPTIDRDSEGNLQTGYDDEREKVVVEETVVENECDGVLCFLGKIVGAITDLASSIADIATSILDGLIGIFVPEDLDFVTEGFNELTDSLTEKISIVEDLKNMVKSIFVESDTNPLKDITLDLPILDKPLQFGNVPFIETGVPILKRVISAIVLIYTVLYLYRKITGRGGVMEK